MVLIITEEEYNNLTDDEKIQFHDMLMSLSPTLARMFLQHTNGDTTDPNLIDKDEDGYPLSIDPDDDDPDNPVSKTGWSRLADEIDEIGAYMTSADVLGGGDGASVGPGDFLVGLGGYAVSGGLWSDPEPGSIEYKHQQAVDGSTSVMADATYRIASDVVYLLGWFLYTTVFGIPAYWVLSKINKQMAGMDPYLRPPIQPNGVVTFDPLTDVPIIGRGIKNFDPWLTVAPVLGSDQLFDPFDGIFLMPTVGSLDTFNPLNMGTYTTFTGTVYVRNVTSWYSGWGGTGQLLTSTSVLYDV